VPLAAPTEAPAREKSLDLLSRASGLPLHAYKPEHIDRQVEATLRSVGAPDATEMAAKISRSVASRSRFRRAIAISVSGHLRDPHQFALLRDQVFPEIVESDGMIRVWSAGCADGSELYDLGSMLQTAEALGRSYLLGSDILDENLVAAKAKQGRFANPQVRARVRWEQRDLTNEAPPPGHWHLILCRNLAIYLRPEVRDELHGKLAGALAPGGFLMLGRSERIGDPTSLNLEPVAPNVYRRRSRSQR
jgi:chemotaxis protein methyltransferase CheR